MSGMAGDGILAVRLIGASNRCFAGTRRVELGQLTADAELAPYEGS